MGSLDHLILRQETKIIAEHLRTHKKLKFQKWPGSVLINSEMLLFPALLEHTIFRLLPILLLLLLILLRHLVLLLDNEAYDRTSLETQEKQTANTRAGPP